MDDDDTGYASGSTPKKQGDTQVAESVSFRFRPFSEELRARSAPSCAGGAFSDSEDSTDSAINLNDFTNSRNAVPETSNISCVQNTQNKTLSFCLKEDGTGYCNRTHSNLKPLTLDRSLEDKFRKRIAAETDDVRSKFEQQSFDPVTSENSYHGESSQIPFERIRHGSQNCNLSFSSDFQRGSFSQKTQISSSDTRQQPSEDLIPSQDFPDFPKASHHEQSLFKRKDTDDVRPLKRVKNVHDTVKEAGDAENEDIPSIDVAGHGNLLLVGNSNMTVNFYSDTKKDGNDAKEDCWEWTGTSEKETQVKNVTGIFRKLADGLSQHVDHRKVARNLDFPDMMTLEDDLKKLRTKKTAESDRIFFVLLRWWKGSNTGNDRDAIKTEMGFLLEDLKLQRMKRNLKQFFH